MEKSKTYNQHSCCSRNDVTHVFVSTYLACVFSVRNHQECPGTLPRQAYCICDMRERFWDVSVKMLVSGKTKIRKPFYISWFSALLVVCDARNAVLCSRANLLQNHKIHFSAKTVNYWAETKNLRCVFLCHIKAFNMSWMRWRDFRGCRVGTWFSFMMYIISQQYLAD